MINPGTTITFGGQSLQTENILTDDIDHHGLPTIDAKQYPLAHANISKIPFIAYPNKIIPITGTIRGTSIVDCDAQIDNFKSLLVGNELPLVIGYNGSTRTYIATVTKCSAPRPNGLTYAKFSIEFTCDVPFGQDPASTTILSAAGRTGAAYNDSVIFGGTAPQVPIATIDFTAITSTGAQTVLWGNADNGQSISINRTWSTGDVVVIDCTQSTVTVNGVQTNFTGAFPEFQPGSQLLGYSDGLTTRTFNISVTYVGAYL